MKIIKESASAAASAAALLKKGWVMICPTDTVYGFLADASNKKAVEKIYKIKGRPKSKPLPLFIKDLAMAKKLAQIDNEQEKYIKKFWPGKYTFILNRKPKTILYGVDKKTVALRLPNYPFLNQLLKKVNRPLVQTSVNISGQPTLTDIEDIKTVFGDRNIVIIDAGNLKKSNPSKIIDMTSQKLKRVR